MLFASKYGKEIVSAATELMPDCGVNHQLIELLSVRVSSPEKKIKIKLLKEIAEEHELDWDPVATETEFFKPKEDLLNGTTQFVSGSKLPLPREKHDGTLNADPDEAHSEQPGSDLDLEMLAFLEVPKAAVQPSTNDISAVPITPPIRAAHHESSLHSRTSENLSQDLHLVHEEVTHERSVANTTKFPVIQLVSRKTDSLCDLLLLHRYLLYHFLQSRIIHQLLFQEQISETDLDLRDFLAAAQAVAETGERAVAAARLAASIAQIIISELTQKKDSGVPEGE